MSASPEPTSADGSRQQVTEELDRELGLVGAVALGVGTMIAAGIFVLSGLAVSNVGAAAIVAFLIAALVAAFTDAAAAVLAPVALGAAEQLGLNPYALLVTVMFGASASFLTPIGYQTNALVYAPGGYRFSDFFRVGLPLHLLLVGVATLLIPVLWPS